MRLLPLLFIAIVSFTAHAQNSGGPVRDFDVTLPAGSKRIGEHRYQSAKSYDDTKKEFHERFLKSSTIKKMGDEINLPHVRATLYKNSDKNAGFYGINIYLNVQTGLTEIFFLAK